MPRDKDLHACDGQVAHHLFALRWRTSARSASTISRARSRALVWCTQPSFSRALVGSPISRSKSRSEEHTSELQSLMRISYAVFCLKKKKQRNKQIDKIENYRKKHYTRHIEMQQ